MSSLLKCGTTLTKVALAIREFFLVGKRVEGTCGGYDSVISRCTIITAAERKQCRCSSEEEHSLDKRKADISKLSIGTSFRIHSANKKFLLISEKKRILLYFLEPVPFSGL